MVEELKMIESERDGNVMPQVKCLKARFEQEKLQTITKVFRLLNNNLININPTIERTSIKTSICFCQMLLLVFVLLLRSDMNLLQAQQVASFPGVTRDLASFCSARPSLSIDLASMIVHVKKATSFNYKLYLFSADNYVFQTGQIVPRDDFRIHSFPVKVKTFNEFLGPNVNTYEQKSDQEFNRVPNSRFNTKHFFSLVPIRIDTSQNRQDSTMQQQASMIKRHKIGRRHQPLGGRGVLLPADVQGDALPGDDEMLSSMASHETWKSGNANEHIQFDRDDQLAMVSGQTAANLRQLHRRAQTTATAADPASRRSDESIFVGQSEKSERNSRNDNNKFASNQQMIMPVGAFSSFHVNITYLVRKDFDQLEPELIQLQVDAAKFQVTQVRLLNTSSTSGSGNTSSAQSSGDAQQWSPDDYAFLKHKLLRDPSTRITSINQIYEDWITRNFYTVVYIQRRLDRVQQQAPVSSTKDDSDTRSKLPEKSQRNLGKETEAHHQRQRETPNETNQPAQATIVTDRLVFRGSSMVLLGADQLDYEVKASAFITEKKGLHYYLEFLTSGKFYLGAIDWTKRPFTIIDAQRFALRQTRTEFDNEELLLCPPSVCYSERPVDELISYGRLAVPDKFQHEISILMRALPHHNQPEFERDAHGFGHVEMLSPSASSMIQANETAIGRNISNTTGETHRPVSTIAGVNSRQFNSRNDVVSREQRDLSRKIEQQSGSNSTMAQSASYSDLINLNEVVESINAAARDLEVRLHLRDWTWSLPRVLTASGDRKKLARQQLQTSSRQTQISPLITGNGSLDFTNITDERQQKASGSKFVWHFEWARRNEIKASLDTYGFVLTGHEIDASYRVYNELYLISANHLITINYTLANETVTSVHPIGDEFSGLSSSLLDPITGAYYDRYANQLYFFKGDRYVGYDYATKTPLEDFQLPPALSPFGGAEAIAIPRHLALSMEAGDRFQASAVSKPLVSSLPVVGILGRQHHVDAIFHDFYDDTVYIFVGAKFYTFQASDFKDGAFRSMRQPVFQCINEHFFDGCRFDEAFPNPCKQHDETYLLSTDSGDSSQVGQNDVEVDEHAKRIANQATIKEKLAKQMSGSSNEWQNEAFDFNDEQQMKLRSIAARGGGLLDVLLENTLIGNSAAAARAAAFEPFLVRSNGNGAITTPSNTVPGQSGETTIVASQPMPQERIVIYLLVAMVMLTIMITIAMILVVLNWTRTSHQPSRQSKDDDDKSEPSAGLKQVGPVEEAGNNVNVGAPLKERIAYPPAISQYLANQYHNQQQASLYHSRTRHSNHSQAHGHSHRYRPPLPPPPPESQLFQTLNQRAQSSGSRTTSGQALNRFSGRETTIVDSSAL